MKRLLLTAAAMTVLNVQANAYWIGDAPVCMVDDSGNGMCHYWSMSACMNALYGQYVDCVFNR